MVGSGNLRCRRSSWIRCHEMPRTLQASRVPRTSGNVGVPNGARKAASFHRLQPRHRPSGKACPWHSRRYVPGLFRLQHWLRRDCRPSPLSAAPPSRGGLLRPPPLPAGHLDATSAQWTDVLGECVRRGADLSHGDSGDRVFDRVHLRLRGDTVLTFASAATRMQRTSRTGRLNSLPAPPTRGSYPTSWGTRVLRAGNHLREHLSRDQVVVFGSEPPPCHRRSGPAHAPTMS
jgi:hypothetical protein